jgi:hypothetical protein
MDIFYTPNKSDLGSFGLDLCSLEKYMLTHTFFDGFKETEKAEPITPVSNPVLVEQITHVSNPVLVEQNIPVSNPVLVEQITPVSNPVLVEQNIPVSNPVLVEQNKPLLEVIKPPMESIKPQKKTRFRSYLKDSLFWCMYVHSHGYAAFETHKAIGTNMLNLMMNEKRLLSDFFNKEDNKTALKNINHKITNVKINEIKCDLMTKPMLSSIEALIPCCVYWKCPIYVDLGNKTYLHFVPNTYVSDEDDNENNSYLDAVLLYMCEGRFELELDAEKKSQRIKEMCQGFYKIPHYEKPLLGIGTYKTDELQYLYDMVITANDIACCTKTKGAPHPTLLQSSKMKKQELYAAIAQKCVLPSTMF